MDNYGNSVSILKVHTCTRTISVENHKFRTTVPTLKHFSLIHFSIPFDSRHVHTLFNMTVPQSHSYSHEYRPTVKRAICLVENDVLDHLKQTIEILGWRLDQVDTIEEAINALKFDQYEAIITAVSTRKASLFDDSIFDAGSCKMIYRSSFLLHATLEAPSTHRIVYGFEAVELDDIRQACLDCGADAVVNSQEGLFDILFGLGSPSSRVRNSSARHPLVMQQEPAHSSITSTQHRLQPSRQPASPLSNPSAYERQLIDEILPQLMDDLLPSIPNELTDEMPFEIAVTNFPDLVGPLLEDESCRNLDYSEFKTKVYKASGTGPTIRVVHVSDTVGLHRSLVLPEGDIFLHGGNFTNGKPQTWLDQFIDFLDWIHDEVLSSFRQVVFIAGSLDIFLDTIACKYNAASREAQKILNRFLSAHQSVAFLENSSISYQGVVIHGSSTTLLRDDGDVEGVDDAGERKRGAFERERNSFVRPEINDECDILLTHRPPSFVFAQPPYELLTDRLYTNQDEFQLDEDHEHKGKKRFSFAFAKGSLREEHADEDRDQKGKKRFSLLSGKGSRQDVRTGMRFDESRSSSSSMFRSGSTKSTGSSIVKQKQGPRLHAFGHYGKDFGVEHDLDTLLLNGSQDRLLHSERESGGIPLVVDFPLHRC